MAAPTHLLALFDLDGTLADYEGRMRTDLDGLRAPGEPSYAVHDRSAPEHVWRRLDLVKAQPGWWLGLPRLPLGFDILRVVRELDYQVQVLTSGPHNTPSAWSEKVSWCHVNIDPAVRVTVTEDKSLVYGKVLVDDTPEFLLGWLEHHTHGWGVMPAHPGNAGFRHPRVTRYDGGNLDAVREALDVVRSRRTP